MEHASHEQGQPSANSKQSLLSVVPENAGPCLQLGAQLLEQGVQDLSLLAREACKQKDC